MNIDTIHQVRPATEFEKLCMDLYDQRARYVILTCDGNEHTVQFDEKRLAEFLSDKKVSDVMASWRQTFLDTIAKYERALETNVHPYWTHTAKKMEQTAFGERWTGSYHEVDLEMTKDQRRYFTSEVTRLKAISGEMKCVKIVPFEFALNRICNIYTNAMGTNKRNVQINKETDKTIVVEAIDTGYGFKNREGRIYTVKKADIVLIQYLEDEL